MACDLLSRTRSGATVAGPAATLPRELQHRSSCLGYVTAGHCSAMIIVGLICLLLGLVLGVPILWTIGIILLVIGLVLMLLGATGRKVGGRAHYW
jgi:hypothetical protein